MAIIQNRESNGLRFGSVENLYQESIIQENYISDFIKAAGLDIRYYKLKTPYPDELKPILDSNNMSIHAYGEAFVQEWEDPIRMIAYIKWDSDGILLNSYGIRPDSTMTMWLDQTDFALALARKLSQWREYKVVGHSEFILDFDSAEDLIQHKNDLSMTFATDLFDGSLAAIVTDNTLNQILSYNSTPRLENPIIVPCELLEHGGLKIDTGRINPLLYKGNHYDPFRDGMVDCHLHLEIQSILRDKHGCIRVMGGIRGGVIYHDTTVIGKYLDKVAPEVGDLIDIPVPAGNGTEQVYNQKYEIVHIEETQTHENFMNPYLRKYIYEINLRAYVPSGQTEPNEPDKRTQEKDRLDLLTAAAEDAAKRIGLYEDFEDNAYGGFQRVTKRVKPSVQRKAENSTINNFDPPAKTKGLRKTTTPLFKFRDFGMTLSLVDDPRNANSYLKLSPTKKGAKVTATYLDHLRADDDNLCLVNGIQAYLLASRFSTPEFDDTTYCIKPIRLKHDVYAQKGGWADQPFSIVDREDDVKLNQNLQDLIGDNTTPEFKSASENRLTFPYTNSYLEVEYERVVGDSEENSFEIWTCFVVLKGDASQTHFPICSYIHR